MKVKAHCTISAPKAKVFNAFSDLKNLANNVRAIKSIELLTPGDVGIGSKFKETRIMFGKESSETMEITQFSFPNYYKEEAQSNGMHYATEWRFVEEGNKTTVSIDFSGTPTTFSAKLLNVLFLFMVGGMKKAFLADMDDLKKMLEKG
ncbi:MAG: SRPBCC family protein [Leptospiraceae bacterium]|nr:SRPBCC family protein [Leptospiraceae bacterium]MCP5493150.1 SRPBCC family protein [Leptospiraceae bacterium]